jgi:hypothetical protein
MCMSPPDPPDMNWLMEEALLLLLDIEPWKATAFFLHIVEEETLEEVGQRFGRNERIIRKWINGDQQGGRLAVRGAKDYLTDILALYLAAHQYNGLEAVFWAFRNSRQANPYDEPFPGTLLYIFWEAMGADVLPGLLARLERARRDPSGLQVLWDLWQACARGYLQRLFDALSLETDVGGCNEDTTKEDPRE